MSYTCHSGGCPGADIAWEVTGEEFKVHTIAYSFRNHIQHSKNQKILTNEELNEGFENVKKAAISLKKSPNIEFGYVRNLICRNWFQIKNATAIFAIGKFKDKKTVDGGTGWAVQMAIDNKKDVFVFDQKNKTWTKYNYDTQEFENCDVPTLTQNFAGIGTRDISDDGLNAILEVYKKTFNN